jgi:hypothetical protein
VATTLEAAGKVAMAAPVAVMAMGMVAVMGMVEENAKTVASV